MLLDRIRQEDDIAVIITNHRYEQYLPKAINSIILQSIKPKEIIIIDDDPITDAAKQLAIDNNIDYQLVRCNNPLLARSAGYDQTTATYLCFLDADDWLSYDYLENALKTIRQQSVSIAFSDLQFEGDLTAFSDLQFEGDQDRRTNFSQHTPRRRISQTNFLHVGCVVEREAITTSQAFSLNHTENCHEDWAFWRRILSHGHTYAKQDSLYHVLKHPDSRSAILNQQEQYIGLRGVKAASLTVVTNNEQAIINWPQDQLIVHLINPKTCQLYYKSDYIINRHHTEFNQIIRSTTSEYVLFDNRDNIDVWEYFRRLDWATAAVRRDQQLEWPQQTLFVGDIIRHYHYVTTNGIGQKFGPEERIVSIQ